jgi:hypothetical protein
MVKNRQKTPSPQEHLSSISPFRSAPSQAPYSDTPIMNYTSRGALGRRRDFPLRLFTAGGREAFFCSHLLHCFAIKRPSTLYSIGGY